VPVHSSYAFIRIRLGFRLARDFEDRDITCGKKYTVMLDFIGSY